MTETEMALVSVVPINLLQVAGSTRIQPVSQHRTLAKSATPHVIPSNYPETLDGGSIVNSDFDNLRIHRSVCPRRLVLA